MLLKTTEDFLADNNAKTRATNQKKIISSLQIRNNTKFITVTSESYMLC